MLRIRPNRIPWLQTVCFRKIPYITQIKFRVWVHRTYLDPVELKEIVSAAAISSMASYALYVHRSCNSQNK
jgi:hypothetical protein